MQYLIGYPIRGEADEYLAALSNRLAEHFKLEPVTNRIDPHITLKAPFESENIVYIEELLEKFTEKEKPLPLRLHGFGHFSGKVIFMNVVAPKQTYMMLRRLQDQLRQIPWLSFKRTEFPLLLHATLCYPKNPQQAKEILHSLRKERATFDLALDSIAILEKRDIRWHIYREFQLVV